MAEMTFWNVLTRCSNQMKRAEMLSPWRDLGNHRTALHDKLHRPYR